MVNQERKVRRAGQIGDRERGTLGRRQGRVIRQDFGVDLLGIRIYCL